MFQNWKEQTQGRTFQISRRLLWDVDWDSFDLQKGRKLVVRRIIERGMEDDYYAAFQLYGGVEGVREIVKEIPGTLSPRDENFVLNVFNLKKEELQCYFPMETNR